MSKALKLSLILPALLCLLVACGRDPQAAAPSGPQALPVKIETAKIQRVGDFTEYLATLRSRNSSVLQPQVDGQITRIFVKSGDRVSAGTPILEIDPLKQQATVRSQESTQQSKKAALDYARSELERRKKLAAQGVISRQDLEQAQTAYDAAKADLEATEASVREQQEQLRYYTVRAPAAGIVGDIPVRVGDRVAQTTILTTLDRGSELEAYISVPAEKSGAVHLGQPVEIVAEDGKPPVRTKVTFVSPRVDTDNQLLLIKAGVPNQDHRFRNEQVVHARVQWQENEVPVIPVTAVSRMGGQIFAFIAEGQPGKMVARQRSIKVGELVGNDYAVLEGIKAGDRVIVSGTQMLADGMPVQPLS
jgi:RND family efflux transporter MFP subunit